MEDMNESKKKGIEPRFTNKLTSLIKTVDETPNENAYKDILAKMASDQSMTSLNPSTMNWYCFSNTRIATGAV